MADELVFETETGPIRISQGTLDILKQLYTKEEMRTLYDEQDNGAKPNEDVRKELTENKLVRYIGDPLCITVRGCDVVEKYYLNGS